MPQSERRRLGGDICAIFVHAGAGYHSVQNERVHLEACRDAAKTAMTFLNNGATAVDAVEVAIKVLEDREITNAGYGSNLAMDGTVEGDATVIDHYGRSGAVGAVGQVRNPIHLARLIYDQSLIPLSLRRVPPNLLVGQGATDFAFTQGLPVLPRDSLISTVSKERWLKWKADLKRAEGRGSNEADSEPEDLEYEQEVRAQQLRDHTRNLEGKIVYPPMKPSSHTLNARRRDPLAVSDTDEAVDLDPVRNMEMTNDGGSSRWQHEKDPSTITSGRALPALPSVSTDSSAASSSELDSGEENRSRDDYDYRWSESRRVVPGVSDRVFSSSRTAELPSALRAIPPPAPQSIEELLPPTSGGIDSNAHYENALNKPSGFTSTSLGENENKSDDMWDTVGAIAVDAFGHIAAGSSSGGIGMKHRGRVGPAALASIGSYVIPIEPEDPERTSVAVVTSGTGEHMVSTVAASTCARRLYEKTRRSRDGGTDRTDEEGAVRAFVERDFMAHPSVKNSPSAGAIGVMGVKKTLDGVWLQFAHNTDSFAVASMHSDEKEPVLVMSRSRGNNVVATGGRSMKYRQPRHASVTWPAYNEDEGDFSFGASAKRQKISTEKKARKG